MITKVDMNLNLKIIRKDFINEENDKITFYLLLNDDMIKALKNEDNKISQFFSDSTFRIIPNKFKEYKLLVILGFDIIINFLD